MCVQCRLSKRVEGGARFGSGGQPAFRWSSGKPLTSAQFNVVLRERLEGYIARADKWFTNHSFRTRAASMMAAMGFGDEDIKSRGRWSSRAFVTYIRLPRSKRIEMHCCKMAEFFFFAKLLKTGPKRIFSLAGKIGGRKMAEFGKKWQKRGRKIFFQLFK
jgi:hypothetical protein